MKIRWYDWTTLLIGVWLMASPWFLEFPLERGPSVAAAGTGVILVVFNLMWGWRFVEDGQELFNMFVGGWLVMSPFALGLPMASVPAIESLVCGVAVFLLAVFGFHHAIQAREPSVGEAKAH